MDLEHIDTRRLQAALENLRRKRDTIRRDIERVKAVLDGRYGARLDKLTEYAYRQAKRRPH